MAGSRIQRVALVMAVMAGLLPLLVLGAASGWSALASLGGSPAAAGVDLLLVTGLAIHLAGEGRPWPQRLARGLAAVGFLAGLAVLGESLRGHPLRLWAPFTAAVQVGAGLSLLGMGFPRGRQGAALAALVPLCLGTVVLLSFGAGAPLLRQEAGFAMSLPSALAAILLGLALLLSAGTGCWPLSLFRIAQSRPGGAARSLGPLLVFVLLVILFGVGGAFYLRGQLAAARRTSERDLLAIGDLKADRIGEWYRLRVGVAEQALRSPLLQPLLRRAIEAPGDRTARESIEAWMRSQRDLHAFGQAALFDARGRVLMQVPSEPGGLREPPEEFASALEQGAVTVKDLHRDPRGNDGKVHLGFLIPVLPLPEGRPPLGALYLRLDGTSFLFPLVQSWPVPSATAETELVRREDGQIVFLNELRHRPGAALSLRLPEAGHGPWVAVRAVQGHLEMIEGPDYRGVPVLAVSRQVEGTPWFMIAKVDESEVYGPVRRQIWITGALLLGLILAAGFGLGALLRGREAEAVQARLALERDQARLSARYEQLMRQANDCIFLLDLEGRIREANARAELQYGWSREELGTLGIRDLRAPEAQGDLEIQWEEARRLGGARFESVHRRRDGSTFPVEVSASRVDLEDETYVLSMVRDITERRAQEAQLAHINRLYAALSQVNEAIVWSRGEADLLARIPEVLVRHGGFSMAWIGEPDPETHVVGVLSRAGDDTDLLTRVEVRDDESPEGQGAVGRALRTGQPCLFNDFLSAPASLPWREELIRAGLASLATFPLKRAGRIWGALAVYASEPGFFGTAEVDLLSEAAMDLSFALDNLDAEAEHRRAEGRLREVQRLESLGVLAAGVAHDMNNVLTAVLTLASFHQEKVPAGTPLAGAFDTITRACLRGRDLVQGLLGFARRELDHEGPVDLNALVEEAVQLLSRTTLQRVRFEMALQKGLGILWGDGAALSRLLVNLCVNAVDAMPKGGTIFISTSALPEGGVALRVRDTGEGMSEEVARRAMEPFFTTKPQGKGTGLGLSMAYGTMKAHGGELLLHSRQGEGTEVVLTFPASRMGPEAIRAVPGTSAFPRPGEGPRLRILLVDDDELVRESVAPMLALLGHRVETVESGAEALRRLENGLPLDLLILDMNMPGMTGAETLPRVLALRPGLPVLLASGHRDEALSRLLAAHPGVSTLAKPFTLQELRARLEAFVGA